MTTLLAATATSCMLPKKKISEWRVYQMANGSTLSILDGHVEWFGPTSVEWFGPARQAGKSTLVKMNYIRGIS